MKTVLRLLLVPLLAASLTSCGDSSSGTHPTELSSLRSRFRPRNALRLPPDAVACNACGSKESTQGLGGPLFEESDRDKRSKSAV